MPSPDPPNVTPLHPSQPYGRVQMSRFFSKLAAYLRDAQLTIDPSAFMLVLINESQLHCYSGGSSALVDEAAQAAHDARNHRRQPTFHDAPEDVRARRQARKEAYEQATPWVCEICTDHRMETERQYREHHLVGHYCLTCQHTYKSLDAWDAHPCMGATSDTREGLRLVTEEGRRT
jgi:hypothetical protein